MKNTKNIKREDGEALAPPSCYVRGNIPISNITVFGKHPDGAKYIEAKIPVSDEEYKRLLNLSNQVQS